MDTTEQCWGPGGTEGGHPAQGWVVPGRCGFHGDCNIPSKDSGCPRPGFPTAGGKGRPPLSSATVTCREGPASKTSTTPGPVCGHQRWLGWAQEVFSPGVTSKVRTSQDWAFGHSCPRGLVLTKPRPATSFPARKAGLPWGSRWSGPHSLREGQQWSPGSQMELIN